MSLQIKWDDIDPVSGKRRYLCAQRFAGEWSFKYKLQRRGDWTQNLRPTREMWEHVLDSLRRRRQRGETVTDVEVKEVEQILANLRETPRIE